MQTEDFRLDVTFAKAAAGSDDQRLVGGFAYVSKRDGALVRDTQGDTIETDVLREAVHEFMKSGRTLGIMHMAKAGGEPIATGEIVEMAVFGGGFTPPGMDPNVEALWIVAKVEDEEVWRMVKAGVLRGFSIGGKGVRETEA